MSSPSFLAKSVVRFEKKKVKKKIGELLECREWGAHQRKTFRSLNSYSLDANKCIVNSVENLYLNLEGERGHNKRYPFNP